jgi:hypothetical protein
VDSGPTPPVAKVRVKNGWVSSRAQLYIFNVLAAPPRKKLTIIFLDNTELSGDQYAQQARYGQADYSAAGQQRSDDLSQGRAGAGRTSDPSNISAQYGGSERSARGQTGGYSDPTTGGNWQGDLDDDTAPTGGGKPTVTTKVKGSSLSLWDRVGAR